MSLMYSLQKFIDVAEHDMARAQSRLARELVHRDADGGPPPDGESRASAGDGAEARFHCRVCDHLSDDRSYCPTCLADTMVAVKKK